MCHLISPVNFSLNGNDPTTHLSSLSLHMNTFQKLTLGSGRKLPTRQSLSHRHTYTGRGEVAHAYPSPTHVFNDPLGRPVRLTGSVDSGVGHPTGCRGDSATLRSPGNTPLGRTDGLCRANPLGHPTRAHAGRTVCDPRSSCGRATGRTIALPRSV